MLLFPLSVFSQTSGQEAGDDCKCIKDDYGVVIKDVTDSTLVYVMKDGTELTFHEPLNATLYYDELGDRQLKKEIYDSVVYADEEPFVKGLFFILFDSTLQIKEVRAINVVPKVPNWIEMTQKYISYFYRTQKKWIRLQDGLPWYLHGMVFNVN